MEGRETREGSLVIGVVDGWDSLGNAITDFGEGGSEGDEDLEDDDEETGSTKITVAKECYSRFAEKEEILQSNPTDSEVVTDKI